MKFIDTIKHAQQSDRQLHIAADTEFQGPLTLTAQFAMRLGDQVVVQMYRL